MQSTDQQALDAARARIGEAVGTLNDAARALQRQGFEVSYKVSRIQSPGLADCPMIGVAVNYRTPGANDDLPVIPEPSTTL